MQENNRLRGWRFRMHEIIYEADTLSGKLFDIGLILAIIISLIAVMLESIASVRVRYGELIRYAEWIITILFTIEYLLRFTCVKSPWKYVVSFYGVIDLMAILPTYLSLLIPGSQYMLAIRECEFCVSSVCSSW